MTDPARIREAIALLESLRGAPELSRATILIDNALTGLRAKLDTPR